MRMVDTHAHLHFKRCLEDLNSIVERFKSEGGKFILNVGINVEDSKEALRVAKIFGYKVAVGVHPHDSKSAGENFIEELENLASDPDVVAIGETGLDYFRDLSPRDVQRRVFISQIELAFRLKKPLVIHVRDAYEDVYAILKDSDLPEPPGVIHAFSADLGWAERFVDLGFFLGIGGPLTYPKNESLREVVSTIGPESILTETDCPYLPPQRFRGKRNEPSYVRYVIEEMERILKIDRGEIEKIIDENAMRIFKGVRG